MTENILTEQEVQSMVVMVLWAMLTFHQLEQQHADIQRAKASTFGLYILSEDFHERKLAYRYAMSYVIGIKRQEMKPFLLHVIWSDPLMPPRNAPINGEEATFSPRRVALSIIAEWQNPEFIPVFLDYVDYYANDPNRTWLTEDPPYQTFVAMKGLINIGKPAVLPCIRELTKTENNLEWMRFQARTPEAYQSAIQRYHNFIMVIRNIVGDEEAIRLIDKEIDRVKKSDENGARNLRSAMNFVMNTKKPVPPKP
ncbi:MAG: hypothetical protein QM703_03325 [Gemmatales bacterium]